MTKTPKSKQRMKRTQSEPALVRGAVVAVLALLASLGVGWATEVDATVATGVVVALIALGQAVWTRYSVTANAKVITRVTTAGEVVTGDAAVGGNDQRLDVITGHRHRPTVAAVPIKPSLVE